MIVTLDSPDGRYDDCFVSNFATHQHRRRAAAPARASGRVRSSAARVFDPHLAQARPLAELDLTPMDVAKAVREQNTQVATGRIGDEPMVERVDLSLSVTTQARLSDPRRVRAHHPARPAPGEIIRLRDVARVELGARDYALDHAQGPQPTMIIGVFLAPARTPSRSPWRARDDGTAAAEIPRRPRWAIPYDTSQYVRVAMQRGARTRSPRPSPSSSSSSCCSSTSCGRR